MVAFVFKNTIFLELVKPHLASTPHFDLDLLFENRLRRRSAGFAGKMKKLGFVFKRANFEFEKVPFPHFYAKKRLF